jgi:hypothetical protein
MTHRACTPRALLAVAGLALGFGGAAAAAERAGGMRQPMDGPAMRQPMDSGSSMRPTFPGEPPSGPTRGESGRHTAPSRTLPPTPGLVSTPPGQLVEDRGRRADSASITHRGTRYVINDGHWYEQRGGELVAVAPPAGVLVESLPDGYSMRWVGGVPYFHADGLYYVWRERSRRYEILQTPPADERAPAGEGRSEAVRDP